MYRVCYVSRKLKIMLLLVSLLFCFSVVNSELNEGDACSSIDGTPGNCTAVKDCPSLLANLLSGIAPAEKSICGFKGYLPIMCCPLTTSDQIITQSTDGRGETARKKCAEYAKAVSSQKNTSSVSITPTSLNASSCGMKSKLVLGKTKTEPKEFPFMASVGFSVKDSGIRWLCSGTLVSESFVLTAAHCISSPEWGVATRVRVGVRNMVKPNEGGRPQERRVVERLRHPDYMSPYLYHDIAILKMDSPVQLNAWVRPACVPTLRTSDNIMAMAIVWGKMNQTAEEGAKYLLKTTHALIPYSTCKTSFGDDPKLIHGVVSDLMICAGEVSNYSCEVDGGGPLVSYSTREECMYNVIGVTSRGAFCDGIPGIYTRVYNYVTWLESVVWPQG